MFSSAEISYTKVSILFSCYKPVVPYERNKTAFIVKYKSLHYNAQVWLMHNTMLQKLALTNFFILDQSGGKYRAGRKTQRLMFTLEQNLCVRPATLQAIKLSKGINNFIMKQAFPFIVFISLILCSCQKPNHADPALASLSGTWRMIIAANNASGLTASKPVSIQGNVDITFTPGIATKGTFTGLTPSNHIGGSDYSTGSNQSLTVSNLFMTKIAETSWGAEFVNNIRSAERYSFDKSGRLIIVTTDKTLTFIKF
ncbi:MAG: hypothetical protein ABI594_05555 [Ginsengibacter sp.]